MSDNVTPINRTGHPDHPGHPREEGWTAAADTIGRPDPADDEGGRAAVLGDEQRGVPASEFFAKPDDPNQEADLEPALRASLKQRGVDQEKAEVRPAKTRALSAAERAAQEAEAERIRLEAEQSRISLEQEIEAERKRFREIDPLRRAPFYTALVVGVIIFLTSGLFSYAAIAAAADWMRPEWAWLTLLVPGFVELFLIFFGIEGIINQAKAVYAKTAAERAYYQRVYRSSTRWMVVFATVAVIGNAAHTLFRWLGDGEIPWYGFVGIAMSALAPLSVVLITKRLSRLVFIYAVEE